MSEQSFPLHWPENWPRTSQPAKSRFDVSFAAARDDLLHEIKLMGGRYPVLSTNLELRNDGLPYARQPQPDDAGVAVFFERSGKQMSFACDRWTLVKDNMRALAKTLHALRGIDRWGASDMLERAYSAFEALPAPGSRQIRPWREVLEIIAPDYPLRPENIEAAYRRLVKTRHPDGGGSAEAFQELQDARAAALRELSK